MKRFRVMQLQNYNSGSFSYVGEQIARALPDNEYEVLSAFLQGSKANNKPSNRIKSFSDSDRSIKGIKRQILLFKIYRYCKQERFDLIIAHRFKSIHVAITLNRLMKIPVIGVVHGIGDFDRKYRQRIIKRNRSLTWKMVGVSQPVKEYLIDLNCGMTERNTVAINNAIDINAALAIQLNRAEARKALHLPENRLIFGTIGRLVPVKGHIYLLEALNRIKDKLPEAAVAIIGEGRSRKELEKYIEEHRLGDRAFILGAHNHAVKYARAFDVFVMPSLSEGLPIALLEGMSASLPVIGSSLPEISDLISDVGFIFKTGDAKDLAQKMMETANANRKDIGERTFAKLKKEHDIETFRHNYTMLAQEMIKMRAA